MWTKALLLISGFLVLLLLPQCGRTEPDDTIRESFEKATANIKPLVDELREAEKPPEMIEVLDRFSAAIGELQKSLRKINKAYPNLRRTKDKQLVKYQDVLQPYFQAVNEFNALGKEKIVKKNFYGSLALKRAVQDTVRRMMAPDLRPDFQPTNKSD